MAFLAEIAPIAAVFLIASYCSVVVIEAPMGLDACWRPTVGGLGNT
jgi:hypothetical protein